MSMPLQLGSNKLCAGIQKGKYDSAIRHFIQRDQDMCISLPIPVAASVKSQCLFEFFSLSAADFSGRRKSAPPDDIAQDLSTPPGLRRK
jgi:hypothetical protein